MPFDEYVEWALYDTEIGITREKNNESVRIRDSDFFYFNQFTFIRLGETLNRGFLFADQARRASRLCFCRNRSRTRKNSLGDLPHPLRHPKLFDWGASEHS